jgi:nucleoside-diphosphate-sugar epimerase
MKILITGGTGYFGKSILAYLGDNNLDIEEVYILSRNPKKLANDFNLKNFSFKITLVAHDIERPIVFDKYVDFVIHAATTVGLQDSLETKKVVIDGTENVLKYCVRKNIRRLLYISSGAIYGSQPIGIKKINENYISNNQSRTVYGDSKYEAEKLCKLYYNNYDLDFVIARGFAFVGPYLPIDTHFAIGNFIYNCLRNEDIIIRGDGKTVRSYMFSDDLACWLFKILLNGKSGEAYNIGSDFPITIYDLAKTCKEIAGSKSKIIFENSANNKIIDYYVPDITKAKKMLNLEVNFNLIESINRTILFHKNNQL